MPDWTRSMQQTFEYYIVDPGTWKDKLKLENVTSCDIKHDDTSDTLGSATIGITDSIGECYIRCYMITVQNGTKEKIPLGTFLVQTPSSSFKGAIRNVSMDAYTPLLELKENPPPLGYSILKDVNIMTTAYMIARERMRAPIVEAQCDETLYTDFVAETSDTWITYLSDLIANAKYKFGLDELGRVLFVPEQNIASLQPVWTYTDDNSSILYPDFEMDHDLYGIPNVVEVIYSGNGYNHTARVVNNDENSPTSTVNRGREIIYRDTDPAIIGNSTRSQIDEYATNLLKKLSSVEYTLTYTHGYNNVRVGDCVRFNYIRSGITDIKAKVTSQSIKCEPGCPVIEKATFTTNLWR